MRSGRGSGSRGRWLLVAVFVGLAALAAVVRATSEGDASSAEQPPADPAAVNEAPPEPVEPGSRPYDGAEARSENEPADPDHAHEGPILPTAEGKGSAAGEPEQVARKFALAWINRPTDKAELRRQNARLVALSRGFWADQIEATLKGASGTGSRGTVVGVQMLRSDPESAEALVTTREQLAPNGKPAEPYHYGLYLARMEPVGGGFAVSSWEPQF